MRASQHTDSTYYEKVKADVSGWHGTGPPGSDRSERGDDNSTLTPICQAKIKGVSDHSRPVGGASVRGGDHGEDDDGRAGVSDPNRPSEPYHRHVDIPGMPGNSTWAIRPTWPMTSDHASGGNAAATGVV